MIRFVPDSLMDWLLRPIAMVAPNGYVYTEIVAPDFRFALALVLLALLAIGLLRRRASPAGPRRPLAALGGLTLVSFLPWLATSGNGRYFMPFLILIGPLCVALAARLRVTAAMRGFAIVLMLVAQAFAVAQNSPWKPFDSWEWIAWKKAPYFEIDTSSARDEADVTYVTIATLSFGAVAPLFPASVRWVNLSAFDTAEDVALIPKYQPVASMLRTGKLRLFARAHVREMDPVTHRPSPYALDVLNGALQRHRLKVRSPDDCRLLRSRSLAQITMVGTEFTEQEVRRLLDRTGFWVCSMEYLPQPAPRPEPTPKELRAAKIFARIEAMCPHFFAPGQSRVGRQDQTLSRWYPDSDASLMLARTDELYMKYERTLNPQRLALGEEVLRPDFRMDCNAFKGRSGLPWDREI